MIAWRLIYLNTHRAMQWPLPWIYTNVVAFHWFAFLSIKISAQSILILFMLTSLLITSAFHEVGFFTSSMLLTTLPFTVENTSGRQFCSCISSFRSPTLQPRSGWLAYVFLLLPSSSFENTSSRSEEFLSESDFTVSETSVQLLSEDKSALSKCGCSICSSFFLLRGVRQISGTDRDLVSDFNFSFDLK